MRSQRRPGVIFQPKTGDALWEGVRQIVEAVRPTLGPVPRSVGISRHGAAPELLDNGGVIARRIIELADRDEDMGAMYIRSVLWRMHEEIGDGTATTAVLFWAIIDGARRYLAAGGNAMLLRRHLETGLQDILTALDQQATPLQSRAEIDGLALTLCQDSALASLIADMLETVGPDGRIELRKGHSRESFLEFVPGSYWDSGLVPNQAKSDSPLRRVDLHEALILISDFEFEDAQQLAPIVGLIEFENIGPLVIMGMKFSDNTLNLLRFINLRKGSMHVAAVKTPEATDVTARRKVLDDLSVLTGGRVFIQAAGDTLKTLLPGDLGAARHIWADQSFLGVVNGKGDPRAVYARLSDLNQLHVQQTEEADQRKTRLRIGQLQGGTVTLMIGGMTEYDIDQRKQLVERAVHALRLAAHEGIVPGGGIALLNCQATLREKASAADPDERAAYTILVHALEAPLRTLLHNAGYEWSTTAAQIQQAGAGYGCDILSGNVVDMRATGICDIARVTREAIQRAVAGAALLLTTDTIIHKRNPEIEFQPR